MFLEFLLGNLNLIGEYYLVDEVQVIAFDGEYVSGLHRGRGETFQNDRLGVAERGLGDYLVSVCGLEGEKSRLRSVLRDDYADFARNAGFHNVDFAYRSNARDDYFHYAVEVASEEAEFTAAHYRLRAIYIERHASISILIGVKLFVLAAGEYGC